LARLRRAEGQIGGIRRMVETGQYCVDILLQISAAQGALSQIAKLVLDQHIRSCVSEAFAGPDAAARNEKIEELLEVFTRYGKPSRQGGSVL
jgi:DNA-binding FrmR family transcriptional regulator